MDCPFLMELLLKVKEFKYVKVVFIVFISECNRSVKLTGGLVFQLSPAVLSSGLRSKEIPHSLML